VSSINNGNFEGTSVTIASMKQAALEMGYEVKDDYPIYDNNIINGITVIFPMEDSILIAYVFEFRNPVAATAYATTLNKTGKHVPILNGRFMTHASADGRGKILYDEEYDFLTDLINGKIITYTTDI